jgi:cell division protein FtsB
MQNFLTLIVVGLLAAAGFEYYQHTQDVAAYVQQRDSLTASIAQLTKANKDLKDEQVVMTQKLADLQKQQVDLQSQTAPTTPAP